MATTHDTPTRIAIATTVLAGLELGSVFPAARVLIYAADNTVLATFALGTPAFPPPAAVDVAVNPVANVLAGNSGDPDHFAIFDRSGIARIFGAVGIVGSLVELEVVEDPARPGNVTPFVSGQPVALGSVVYRAPP